MTLDRSLLQLSVCRICTTCRDNANVVHMQSIMATENETPFIPDSKSFNWRPGGAMKKPYVFNNDLLLK